MRVLIFLRGVGATLLKCGYNAIEDGGLKIPYAQIKTEKGSQTTLAGNWFYYCAIFGQIFSLSNFRISTNCFFLSGAIQKSKSLSFQS